MGVQFGQPVNSLPLLGFLLDVFPIKYVDPSGHCVEDPFDDYYDYECWALYNEASSLIGAGFDFLSGWGVSPLQSLIFWLTNGVSFTNQAGGQWTSAGLSTAVTTLNDVKGAISDMGVVRNVLGLNTGGLTITMCPTCDPYDQNHDYSASSNTIRVDNGMGPITHLEMLHELGHVVDWNVGSGGWWSNEMLIGNGWQEVRRPCWFFFTCATGTLTQDLSYTPPNPNSFNHSPQEDFADTFAGYVLDSVGHYPSGWNPMPQGRINALSVQFQP